MLKLMKYEFRKTMFTKLILLGITAVAEAAFLISLYTNKEGSLAASIGILTLLAIGGVLVIGLQSVLTLHHDMNTRHRITSMIIDRCRHHVSYALIPDNDNLVSEIHIVFKLAAEHLDKHHAAEAVVYGL